MSKGEKISLIFIKKFKLGVDICTALPYNEYRNNKTTLRRIQR